MKAAVLVCAKNDGSFVCKCGSTYDEIVSIARVVRDAGVMDGEVVVSGVMLHTERVNPVMKFRCKPAVVAESKSRARSYKK